MSADNWGVCPKCYPPAPKKRPTDPAKLYGKVDEAAYRKAVRDFDAWEKRNPDPENELREDYEIGIYDGQFYISYGAECAVCGFKHTFEHKVDVVT